MQLQVEMKSGMYKKSLLKQLKLSLAKLVSFTISVSIDSRELNYSRMKIYVTPQPLSWGDYKYLSCVYGVDRKICHEGH